MRGLYAIVDTTVCRRARVDPVEVADAILAAGPAALQLRAKTEGARVTLELLRALAPRCAAEGTQLFANDRPDLALLAGCGGVHLGQSDLAPADVRRLAARAERADLRIGASTHDEGELDRALEEPIDVLAIGPIFGTASKLDPEPTLGLEEALRLAARAQRARPSIARVAIGGIGEAEVARLASAFDAFAVIGALLPAGLEGAAALAAARSAAIRLRGAFEAAA